MQVTAPDVNYVHEFEFAQGSQWGAVVLQLAARSGLSGLMLDPEAEPDEDGRYPKGSAIRLTGRMYTDVQLGKLDGPGRFIRKDDPLFPKALTPLGALSKRERRKVRKLRRANTRKGIEMTTVDLISVVLSR